MSDGCHVVRNAVLVAQEKNGSYCTPLQNKHLIFKNLAFHTRLQKTVDFLRIWRFAPIREIRKLIQAFLLNSERRIRREAEIKETFNVCRVLYVLRWP